MNSCSCRTCALWRALVSIHTGNARPVAVLPPEWAETRTILSRTRVDEHDTLMSVGGSPRRALCACPPGHSPRVGSRFKTFACVVKP
eukprot:6324231-Prymnesium_polylepis.1